MAKRKNPAAVALGKLGGRAKVSTKGFGSLSPAERKETARKAAESRWKGKRKKK